MIPSHLSHRLRGFLILCTALACAMGCNLPFDLSDYPYPTPIDPADVDTPLQDTSSDGHGADGEDVPPAPQLGPKLIFTELMIRVSPPPDSFQELGEYIEIKNVGDAPADPRHIVIDLLQSSERINVDRIIDSEAERIIVNGLKAVPPGGYFVFVRDDSDYYGITKDLAPGTYYEYGVWNRPIGLPNFTHTLRLLYEVGPFVHEQHDEVGWEQGHLIDMTGVSTENLQIHEDIAMGVRNHRESAKANSDPANWCYHVLPFGEGFLYGSPGRPSPENCL
ncbi:MAG: hypothetical protein ACNA8W_14450 [Bradymonadaceae bacterium]